MKKQGKVLLLLILMAFLSIQTSKAQVSINSSHMPQSGDSLRFSVALLDTAVLQSYQNTGGNNVWRFDSLQAIRQGVSTFINSSQSPYNTVPQRIASKLADTLNLGVISVYEVFDFYNNSSTDYSLDYRGLSIPTGLPILPVLRISPPYSDKDEVYQFPLNYLDVDSSTFDFAYNNLFPPAYYGTAGSRVNNVEAWGTVTTPFGTFNCIKVVTDVISYDSISFGGNAFGTNVHRREYKWISPQEAIPVVTLSGNVVAGNFVPSNIQYRDSLRPSVPNLFAPIALFNADTTMINAGDTLFLNNQSVSITPLTYQWSISPINNFVYVNGTNANSENPAIVFNSQGFYDVELIVDNGQGSDTLRRNSYVEVKPAVSLKELRARKANLKLFPNPLNSGEKIQIELADEQIGLAAQLTIHSSNGKLIYNEPIVQNGQAIKMIDADLESGTYIVQIQTEGNLYLEKLLVH